MGRYYSGDIEGKFWFAVQDSDDGEFFGAEVSEAYTPYHCHDIEKVKDGLKKCKEKLGANLEKLDKFFRDVDGYTDKDIEKLTDADTEQGKEILVWYARLELGRKIHQCMLEQGSCSFDAEH